MGIKLGLSHLLFLGAILQYLLKTCRFSPRVPLDSLGELRFFFRGLETHGSAVRLRDRRARADGVGGGLCGRRLLLSGGGWFGCGGGWV